METLQEPLGIASVGSPLHWHFRAMPPEVQSGVIRRLALSGVPDEDIAARTGWSVDRVRRVVQEDECIKRLASVSGNSSRAFHVAPHVSFEI
jgi:hypothetical protein